MHKEDWIIVVGGLGVIGLMVLFNYCISRAEKQRAVEEEESRELQTRRFEL